MVDIQEVRREKGGTEQVEDYIFFIKGKKIIRQEQVFFLYVTESYQWLGQ
jgi:hypothetical protein